MAIAGSGNYPETEAVLKAWAKKALQEADLL
jgi:hypothetical protein